MNPGVYKHFKGKYYLVLFTAIHSETRELMVVYIPLHQSTETYVVRPMAMFNEMVIADGDIMRRFTYVG